MCKSASKMLSSWMLWLRPIIPTLRRLRSDDQEFETSLSCTARPCLKKNEKKEGRVGGRERGREEGTKEGRKEERRKEGRNKEGREEGRKEGRRKKRREEGRRKLSICFSGLFFFLVRTGV
jgi:flagellar biosynthesis/type III secretory pathway protein FliH